MIQELAWRGPTSQIWDKQSNNKIRILAIEQKQGQMSSHDKHVNKQSGEERKYFLPVECQLMWRNHCKGITELEKHLFLTVTVS